MQKNSPETIDMLDERINIRRTVDGQPLAEETAPARRRRKKTDTGPEPTEAPAEKRVTPKADRYIWGIYILMVIVAVVELFSASSGEIKGSNVYAPLIRQMMFIGIGFLLILGLQKIHYVYISRFALLIAVISGVLLLYANLWGANINGAQRAIMIGSITIQPPEIAKLAVVLVMAMILGKNQKPHGVSTKGIIASSAVVAVFAALTYQNGLTNMVIIMFACLVMMLVGGIPLKKFVAVMVVFGMIGGLLLLIKKQSDEISEFDEVAKTENVYHEQTTEVDRGELREGRISMWLKGTHPDDKITDNNRQDVLSRMAQAHGGVFGKGPGNSRESSRLPLAFSDYIYSIIVEDTGLVGGLALMVLYLSLVARAGVLAWRFKRAFPAFLIMGCAALIVFQALVHMAIVTGAMPVSGQPLPFISKGGTSVVIMSAAIGIMLSVSRFADTISSSGESTLRENIEDVPEEYQAANITSYNKQ